MTKKKQSKTSAHSSVDEILGAKKVGKPFYKRGNFLVLMGLLLVLAVIYVGGSVYFNKHFLFGTTINGVEVGRCTPQEVEQLITREIEGYSLTITEREDAKEQITGNSIVIAPVFNGEVEALLDQQNSLGWMISFFKKSDLTLDRSVTYDETAFEEVFDNLKCISQQRKPVDATCSEYSPVEGYTLVSADMGTTVDSIKTKHLIIDSITSLSEELNLEENSCYKNPDILDDNEKLNALIKTMNTYVGTTVNYDMGSGTETLDGSTIHEWLSFDENLEPVIDEEAVTAYVKSLGSHYNTAYQAKTLVTSYGPTVTISGGSYGWLISNSKETEKLMEEIKSGETVSREPEYAQTANSHEGNDYGNSYVEINLTAQHLFVYKNGSLVVESDLVSGKQVDGHSSPTGAFGVTYTTTDAVLRGDDYETPVKYWMPFAGDVGMHDATWRKSFGGVIYKNSGSHGCINLPLGVAKTIYNTVSTGYPVLVYTLAGTESTAGSQQEAAAVVQTIGSIGAVTLDSASVIATARSQYDALSDTAKGYVTNYDVLTAAEQAYAALASGQPAAETVTQ